jgi:hypothetical protein
MSEPGLPLRTHQTIDLPELHCPDVYDACDDLAIISCYFNPSGYRTKLINFEIFENIVRRSNISLLVVECAFGDADFALTPSAGIVQVRSPHVMWQKERLINIALQKLPKHITKIAWLDCDVLFSNPHWLTETSKLLDEFYVVQPFQAAIRLPQGSRFYSGEGEIWDGFGFMRHRSPEMLLAGGFQSHGHTGFAWAARVGLLKKHGLYDACISGGGDHFMAHAMCGDFKSVCVERMMSANLKSHFTDWGEAIYQDIQGRVGYTPGVLLHLWHGDTENRQYLRRHDELIEQNFDPKEDLQLDDNGIWCWKSNKPGLRRWAREYFYHRKEDGD